MFTDPIADYLTRIRNASSAGHRVVEIPASNLKKEVTKILFDQGYILSYKFEENEVQGIIKIALKYDRLTKEPVISPPTAPCQVTFFHFSINKSRGPKEDPSPAQAYDTIEKISLSDVIAISKPTSPINTVINLLACNINLSVTSLPRV